MAKNFKKGIDNVFSPTVESIVETSATPLSVAEPTKEESKLNDFVSYNIRYTKELKKRIKSFCLEHEIFMNDVFTQGAIIFMEKYKT